MSGLMRITGWRRLAGPVLAIAAPVILWRMLGAPPVVDAVAAATAPPPNAAPVIRFVFKTNAPKRNNARIVDVGETLTLSVVGSDPNRDDVQLGQDNPLPPGATWTPAYGSPARGVLTWTPKVGATAWTGSFWAMDYPVSGAYSKTTRQNITIQVGSNTAPVLDSIVPPVAKVGKTLRLVITASDADGDILKFLSQNLPTGAKLSPATFSKGKYRTLLTWKPAPSQAGQSFTASIIVQDNYPNPHQDSAEVTLVVGP